MCSGPCTVSSSIQTKYFCCISYGSYFASGWRVLMTLVLRPEKRISFCFYVFKELSFIDTKLTFLAQLLGLNLSLQYLSCSHIDDVYVLVVLGFQSWTYLILSKIPLIICLSWNQVENNATNYQLKEDQTCHRQYPGTLQYEIKLTLEFITGKVLEVLYTF